MVPADLFTVMEGLLRTVERGHGRYPATLATLRLLRLLLAHVSSRRVVVDLREAFQHFDKNGDKDITRQEFADVS